MGRPLLGPQEPLDAAKAIAVDNSGNVYVTGRSFSDYATIKYNATGQQQWVAREVGGEGNAIALDGAGNVYVTGQKAADYGTINYNSAGQQQWRRATTDRRERTDVATAIVLDDVSNVYVTGRSERTVPSATPIMRRSVQLSRSATMGCSVQRSWEHG